MPRTFRHALLLLSLLFSLLMGPGAARAVEVQFNRDVRPILSKNCFQCHGADSSSREADLRLDLREQAVRDLGGYAAVTPGDAASSELIRRIDSEDENERMPPEDSGKELTVEERETLRNWINDGAVYQRHWSFEPPRQVEIPPVVNEGRDSPIDRFIDAELSRSRLAPSPPADRRTLIRRVMLDLTGLPPTPEQVREFLADASPDAYEKLVDRLLASPHCAERLAQDWLDAARYADTNGFSIDDHRDMWGWRDWVVKAFLTNMPYDQFIREQVAGDLLPDATESQRIATGFLRNSMNTHEGGTIPEEYQMIYTLDKVDTVATTMLGLTMKCAQCHDHKYDPISQRDFYRFYAFFDRSTEPGKGAANGNTNPTLEIAPPLIEPEQLETQLRQREAELQYCLAELPDELQQEFDRTEASLSKQLSSKQQPTDAEQALLAALKTAADKRTAEQAEQIVNAVIANNDAVGDYYRSVGKELEYVRSAINSGTTSVMVMNDAAADRTTHIRLRGAYDQLGDAVQPGLPESLTGGAKIATDNRLDLANWLVANNNPLTARVAVNRYWHLLFGAGLVETVEDFGTQGALPSHPELLDWLARDFAEHGWDVRRLLKQYAMTAAYRQSSQTRPGDLETDPLNRLLARASRRRLSAEAIRDNALAISGLLNPLVGGPSIYPPQPDGLWKEVSHYGHPTLFTAQAYYPSRGANRWRRSMYIFRKRTSPPPMLSVFDAPSRETCTVRRLQTNTPLQAFVLLNDPQFVAASRAFARRILTESEGSIEARLNYAFELAMARPPLAEEREILSARVTALLEEYSHSNPKHLHFASLNASDQPSIDPPELRAWSVIASIILNLDEVITKG